MLVALELTQQILHVLLAAHAFQDRTARTARIGAWGGCYVRALDPYAGQVLLEAIAGQGLCFWVRPPQCQAQTWQSMRIRQARSPFALASSYMYRKLAPNHQTVS